MSKLGRLEKVDLRGPFPTEAGHFTPWLADDENLALLSLAIGFSEEGLEREAVEKSVGPFRADILCRDTVDGSWVLIENQLAKTDHTHLGQLMTYAAGLQAVTIVWIAERFTDEHRAALDWLNEITGSDHRFFGVEIELWRIGDSLAAPRFSVIARPNDWSRSVTSGARPSSPTELSETQALQLEYWSQFAEVLNAANGSVTPRKPTHASWHEMSIGRTGFALSAAMYIAQNWIRAELFIYGRKEDNSGKKYFEMLHDDREAIQSVFGEKLDWDSLEGRMGARVSIKQTVGDLTDRTRWPEQHKWLVQKILGLHFAFHDRVKALDLANWKDVPLEMDPT